MRKTDVSIKGLRRCSFCLARPRGSVSAVSEDDVRNAATFVVVAECQVTSLKKVTAAMRHWLPERKWQFNFTLNEHFNEMFTVQTVLGDNL